MITIPMRVAVSNVSIPVSVSATDVGIAAKIATQYVMSQKDNYSGQYEFEPSCDTQTIHTANLVLNEDIVIDPIPSNYGRISFDGSTITVY